MTMGVRTLWAIHAGKADEAEALFVSGVVALGWDRLADLSAAPDDRAVFKSKLAIAYPETKERGVPASAGQLYRFVHQVKQGDAVVYSSSRNKTVRFGRIRQRVLLRGR